MQISNIQKYNNIFDVLTNKILIHNIFVYQKALILTFNSSFLTIHTAFVNLQH